MARGVHERAKDPLEGCGVEVADGFPCVKVPADRATGDLEADGVGGRETKCATAGEGPRVFGDRVEQDSAGPWCRHASQDRLNAARDPVSQEVIAGPSAGATRDGTGRGGAEYRVQGLLKPRDLVFVDHLFGRRVEVMAEPGGREDA